MGFLLLIVRIAAALLVLRLALRWIAGRLRAPGAPGAPRQPPMERELVRDRVCNTFLTRERALTALVAGRREHFCSDACREKALALAAEAS